MQLIETIFGEAKVFRCDGRRDVRGGMSVVYSCDDIGGFTVKEQRVYTMPRKGTFFGIHFQDGEHPQGKLVTLLRGSGVDYVVDLRRKSPTYKRWRAVELSAENGLLVYIPAGFGHAFYSTSDDTVQLFSADEYFGSGAKSINYRDESIGLVLPGEAAAISEADRNAPYLSGL